MKRKIFYFAGIRGSGRTVADAKEDCEVRIARMLQPPILVSTHAACFITRHEEGGFCFNTNYRGDLMSSTLRQSDIDFVLLRCKEILAEGGTSNRITEIYCPTSAILKTILPK